MRRKLIVAMLSGILCACPIEVYADAEMTQEETDMNSLSEEEYKKKCTEMWYEDITFSKKSLEGQFVKIDLYVEGTATIDPYDLMISDKTEKYNLSSNCSLVGIYSKDTDSYGSGNDVGILYSNDYDFRNTDYVPGTYLTLYGEIIDYGIDYWSGHNSAWFMPKYIENVRDVK